MSPCLFNVYTVKTDEEVKEVRGKGGRATKEGGLKE